MTNDSGEFNIVGQCFMLLFVDKTSNILFEYVFTYFLSYIIRLLYFTDYIDWGVDISLTRTHTDGLISDVPYEHSLLNITPDINDSNMRDQNHIYATEAKHSGPSSSSLVELELSRKTYTSRSFVSKDEISFFFNMLTEGKKGQKDKFRSALSCTLYDDFWLTQRYNLTIPVYAIPTVLPDTFWRLISFREWLVDCDVWITSLVSSGFYSSNVEIREVVCYNCGLTFCVRDLNGRHPRTYHMTMSPDCPFLGHTQNNVSVSNPQE